MTLHAIQTGCCGETAMAGKLLDRPRQRPAHGEMLILDRYLIRRDGDSIVVDPHRWVPSDKDPAGWEAAAISTG